MTDWTSAQKARVAIRSFTTIVDALSIKGVLRPFDPFGQILAECLENLSPEIYGSMNDPRVVEIKGLEYTIDRLPRGIEEVHRITLTEVDHFDGASFEKIVPLRRRRDCYRVSEDEICMIITRGLSEIYDTIAHLTFLYLESRKIYGRMKDGSGKSTMEWKAFEEAFQKLEHLDEKELDQAVWNLSLVLGRPYAHTRESYDSFETNRRENNSNNGLFSLIYHLGRRWEEAPNPAENRTVIHLTPSLMNIIGHLQWGEKWAADIKAQLVERGLTRRPLHIISANMHSVSNTLYGYGALRESCSDEECEEPYLFFQRLREHHGEVIEFAAEHGLTMLKDTSGTNIDCQLIDTAMLDGVEFHPQLRFHRSEDPDKQPVILVMDYAFGTQAFEVMDRLLRPYEQPAEGRKLGIGSISIMGKAGILIGGKGDIMLANAHVIEGTSDNYIFDNDLRKVDFDVDIDVYEGPMITVVGTSLQNKDILQKLQSDWNTVGLEMEGGHYQKAISAAVVKGNIPRGTKVRYAYYASDNPLESGETLAAGPMGDEGIRPTYTITRAILEKIFQSASQP